MEPRERKGAADGTIPHQSLLARKTWKPLPPVVVLGGPAGFFKGRIIARFTKELFGDTAPEIRRFQGSGGAERGTPDPSLATILDELRTPSFFSPWRIIILEDAEGFLEEHGADLVPFLTRGFSGGHLILTIRGKLDRRTKFSKAIAGAGWVVDCPQPFDRPAPWETAKSPWESDLSRWVVAHAREKGLEMDLRTAFLLHERAGTELTVLDEALEKVVTYLATRGTRKVDEAAVSAVVGDTAEDTVFTAVDLFLEGRTAETLDELSRLFERGIRTDRSGITTEPMTIALLFVGALLPKLRALRRAHAMSEAGDGPERWTQAGLVSRPFLSRFQRQMAATPPRRIARTFEKLLDADRAMKSGGSPARLLELVVIEAAGALHA